MTLTGSFVIVTDRRNQGPIRSSPSQMTLYHIEV